MRFFRNFVVENVRNGAVEADGKPARAKLKGNRSREARKGQTESETICGKPENARRRARQFTGSPKTRNLAREACGKAAREKLRE